jgi:endonuclease/exonuclease/phosphatase family metal-dependent hydrolase
MSLLAAQAAAAGAEAAAAVLAGQLNAESAGDQWVAFADRSHDAGVAFLAAYDSAGAPR